MLPGEIFNVDPLKSLETFILIVVFASSKLSRRANKLHVEDNFARIFKRRGARVPSASLGSYIHDCQAYIMKYGFYKAYLSLRETLQYTVAL